MSIDPQEAAIAGSVIALASAWGGSAIVPFFQRRKTKEEAKLTKASADATVVASAIELTEALERHANNLRVQLAEHELRSHEREKRYEEKIAELERNWNLEKARCDSLELQVHELTYAVQHSSMEIERLKVAAGMK